MSNLKRIFAVVLSMAMVFSIASTSALAADNTEATGGYTVVFDESDYAGLALEEAGAKKLRDSGYSQNLVDAMPTENLQIIGASPKAQQFVSYYMEVISPNGNTDLIAISESDYETASAEVMQNRAEAMARNITVVDENNQVLYSPEDAPTPYVTKSIDGGTLSVVTTLYQVTGGQLSEYLVTAEYAWTTPPEYRGTDYFGITRDTDCSMVPGSFGNATYYREYRYQYLATVTGVVSALHSTIDHPDEDLPNEDSAANGFVIKENMPVDVNPPLTMLAGSSFLSRNYADMQGAVWYQGVLQTPSIYPQNFNHWGTYWHQYKTVWGTISLSVPKGASFTVDPEAKYCTPVEHTILVTWNKVS